MPILILALFALALPLAKKDVPELEPFDESAFDAAFDRLRGRKARAVGQPSTHPTPSSPIPFIGTLIKRLPRWKPADAESTEE